jgi:hypothetical protein
MENIDDFFYEEKSKYHQKYLNKPTPSFKNGWKDIKLRSLSQESPPDFSRGMNWLLSWFKLFIIF